MPIIRVKNTPGGTTTKKTSIFEVFFVVSNLSRSARDYFKAARYFSASIAALQPLAAATMA